MHNQSPLLNCRGTFLTQKKNKIMKKTKSSQVLKHLQTRKTITSWQAIEMYGATRLSAIIFNLRQKGYIISSIDKKAIDRNGNTTIFSKYELISEPKK
jgi:hypothetical protein